MQENQEVWNEEENEKEKADENNDRRKKRIVEPTERIKQQTRALAMAFTRIRMRIITSKVGAKRNVYFTTFETK